MITALDKAHNARRANCLMVRISQTLVDKETALSPEQISEIIAMLKISENRYWELQEK